jgi:hypothetical protein
LVELLASLVIGSVVVLILFELLAGQGRIARLQAAREEVQHNARASLELITSELRGVDPASLVEAGPDRLGFRLPRAWGVVCAHTSTRLAVAFPEAAVPALRSGEEWVAIPSVDGGSGWHFLAVSDLTGNTAERGQAVAHCDALGVQHASLPATRSRVRMYGPRDGGASAPPLGLAGGGRGHEPGTPVYTFDEVRYHVAEQAGTGEWWIRRNTGPALAMHPLAGPVPEHGGLRFRYLDAAGAEVSDPAAAAERVRTRRVEVTVTIRSRARFGGQPLQDSAATGVFLRNRN